MGAIWFNIHLLVKGYQHLQLSMKYVGVSLVIQDDLEVRTDYFTVVLCFI